MSNVSADLAQHLAFAYLAQAFDEGKWAAYHAERDGADGSEVANPYSFAPTFLATVDRIIEEHSIRRMRTTQYDTARAVLLDFRADLEKALAPDAERSPS